MIISKFASIGLALSLSGTVAIAQDDSGSVATISQARELFQPSWTSPAIAQIGAQLAGTWRTEDPIDSMPGSDGTSVPVYIAMSIAAVPVDGVPNAFYVESARTDSAWEPYRRAIFEIYPYKDGHRLRTYEIAVGDVSDGVFDGMFAAPEWFPQLSRDNLIATMDVDITPTSDGFTGQSPYPFPTGAGGAVEMTSSVTLAGDVLTVADRGYDAKGNIVWGAEGQAYTFLKSQGLISIQRREDGMVILDYGGASGPIVSNGDRMHVNYEGFLADMTRFDSSYQRGTPFIFAYPPGTRAITGWGIGMENFAEGGRRKLIIPGYLGYGPNGNPRANIPGDATLMFNLHFAHVDVAEDATEPAPSGGASTVND
ncbi:MAG: CpcT/CpeT family chromophore lyase [Phycisphaerales bacterium]